MNDRIILSQAFRINTTVIRSVFGCARSDTIVYGVRNRRPGKRLIVLSVTTYRSLLASQPLEQLFNLRLQLLNPLLQRLDTQLLLLVLQLELLELLLELLVRCLQLLVAL